MKVKKLGENKQVIILKKIDEVMREEFQKMIVESSKDPLLKLIQENKLDSMTLDQIRVCLRGKKK